MLNVSFGMCVDLDCYHPKCLVSRYCAKVRAEAKKRLFIFFLLLSHFLDELREETLATQAKERQASKKFYNNWSENSRSQIVFRTDIVPKIVVGCP